MEVGYVVPLEGYDPLPQDRAERVAVYERDPVEYCRRLSHQDLMRLLLSLGKTVGIRDDEHSELVGERWAEWREERRRMVEDADE